MGWWSGWCWGRAVVVHISMLTLEEMPLIPLSSRRTPIYRMHSAANRKVSNSVDRSPKNNWKFKVKIKHYLSMKLKIKHFLSNFFCWRLFAVTRATASAPAPSHWQLQMLRSASCLLTIIPLSGERNRNQNALQAFSLTWICLFSGNKHHTVASNSAKW